MTKIIYRAELQTRNFNFSAYGETKTEAMQGIKKAMAIHSKQYNVPGFAKDFAEDIEVTHFVCGAPYRDDQELSA